MKHLKSVILSNFLNFFKIPNPQFSCHLNDLLLKSLSGHDDLLFTRCTLFVTVRKFSVSKKKRCNIKIFSVVYFLYVLSFTINAFNFVSQIAVILENHVLAITSSPFFMVWGPQALIIFIKPSIKIKYIRIISWLQKYR